MTLAGQRLRIAKVGAEQGSGLGAVRSVVENANAWLLDSKRRDRRQERSAGIVRSLLAAGIAFATNRPAGPWTTDVQTLRPMTVKWRSWAIASRTRMLSPPPRSTRTPSSSSVTCSARHADVPIGSRHEVGDRPGARRGPVAHPQLTAMNAVIGGEEQPLANHGQVVRGAGCVLRRRRDSTFRRRCRPSPKAPCRCLVWWL